jgi:hypothetical protein
MNTEKINAYKKIVETLKDVNALRTFDNTGTPERAELDKAALLLEELSWSVISEDLTRMLDAVSYKTNELKNLSKKINEKYHQLSNISETIGKTADVIGVLVEIITKALAVGLI